MKIVELKQAKNIQEGLSCIQKFN